VLLTVLTPICIVSRSEVVHGVVEAPGKSYIINWYALDIFVCQFVNEEVISALSSTVPPEVAFARTTKTIVPLVTFRYLTPTITTFMVSEAPIPESVTL